MRHLRRLVPAALICALAPTGASAATGPLDHDYAAYARNIIPSGQRGSVPTPAKASDQARMYDALTPLFDKVSATALLKDFKSEGFGATGSRRKVEKVPRAGVRIVRDSFDVPHITATTYSGGIWAAGWVIAEDRTLLLEQARYNARVAAIDVPGMSAIALVAGLQSFSPSAQTEQVLARQTKELQKSRDGRAVLRDIDTYIAGINAYLKQSKSSAKRWTRNDVYAVNALKDQFLGEGGGDEARRTQMLTTLTGQMGLARGRAVFDDLRQHDDPEQPASIDGRFPYERTSSSTAGNVLIDPGSWSPVSATAGVRVAGSDQRAHASNVLMIDAKHSATGHPLMVGGPQIGYFFPGLTLEMDMHAPGLVWRGATSAPFPGYLLIGRGADFAVTLTSAGGDVVDQYAETLCGGSDTKYLYKGACRDMGFFDAGVLKGTPDRRVTFHTTVHGPVVGYATVGGVRVAISSKRSSYGKDVLDLLFNRDLSTGRVDSPKTFFAAAARTPQTFNSFYVDDEHIAEYTSGLLPVRPAGVDPGLLTNGNGSYEWKGFLAASAHPHGTDPKSGQIVNWNNNVARGFGSADDEWMRAGASGRVDLLNKNLARLAKKGKHTLATVTSAMNAAATQDVRVIDTVPLIARVLAGSAAPDPADRRMLDLLVAWGRAGGSRLDRNGDGRIDDPGAAILDAAWNGLADAVMKPVLGAATDQLASIVSRFEAPPGGQYSGWYQYMDKDLRTLLGDKVSGRFSQRYCGAGDKGACQSALWSAIDAARVTLTAAQGADPAAWRADADKERVSFVPGLLKTTMRYTNRPSGIQQVISFDSHR